ncbi:hypothetical protein HCH_03286 [Hahella chejuensis KCTC 2396]|uniref:Uncharacterized protein n=1 Tax=Hahella chejuensis (strain KCTC 2396) TaxID=349521 RepID=Q2SH32_HAHCH|nr:CesT family type III secretion system chaperone [Hahella chejuensis]ABC30042.1 hypothetical protein HCH_03286 [Hahella chejuensis KCTC 2396]
MHTYNQFESLLFRFCQRHQIAMIRPDANLHYVVYIDNLAVRCFSQGGSIYLQVDLEELPGAGPEHTQTGKHLMQQSLLDSLQTSSVVALDQQHRVILFQTLPLDDCQLHDLETAMETLANQAEAYGGMLGH